MFLGLDEKPTDRPQRSPPQPRATFKEDLAMRSALVLVALALAPSSALGQVTSFQSFPDVKTTAKAGESILLPSYNWLEALSKGKKQNLIFYNQKMVTPGATTSQVAYTVGKKEVEVHNSYIIAIPKGGKAKVGDIVLTWWQSGSGMQRAIVVKASKPSTPVVRYLDIDYDNPAKSRDKSTTIGKMDEELAANTFTRLTEGAPGSVYRCVEGGKGLRVRLVAKAPSGQLFVIGQAGMPKVFAKEDCKPTPLQPKVKAGDEVEVEFAGKFTKAKVERVDKAIGRVFVKLFGKESAVAFGDVMP
jgi:hypothetical protein